MEEIPRNDAQINQLRISLSMKKAMPIRRAAIEN